MPRCNVEGFSSGSVVKNLLAKQETQKCGFNPWVRRRKWHPTPVILPRKSHGQRSRWAKVHGVTKRVR